MLLPWMIRYHFICAARAMGAGPEEAAMRTYSSLEEFLRDLPALAAEAEEALRGQEGLFLLETRQGARVWLRLREGRLSIEEDGGAPDCAVTADEQALLDIINGRMHPWRAWLGGKIRVRGEKGRLMALISLMNGKTK